MEGRKDLIEQCEARVCNWGDKYEDNVREAEADCYTVSISCEEEEEEKKAEEKEEEAEADSMVRLRPSY